MAALSAFDEDTMETFENFENITTMTPRELEAMADALDQFIEEMEDIEPPKAAEEYHEAMIDTFVLLSRMIREYATTGSVFALLPYTESIESVSWDVYYAEMDGYDRCGSTWVEVFGYPEMPES